MKFESKDWKVVVIAACAICVLIAVTSVVKTHTVEDNLAFYKFKADNLHLVLHNYVVKLKENEQALGFNNMCGILNNIREQSLLRGNPLENDAASLLVYQLDSSVIVVPDTTVSDTAISDITNGD